MKRLFTLYGKKKHFRADHAHKKCTQIIIPLRGLASVKIKSRGFNKIFKLSVNKKALFIPPYNWVTIFLNDNDSILTLCDYKYDKKEYISEYQNFKKIISKMKLLITGGLGHIGSFIIKDLVNIKKIKKIYLVDNLKQ